MVYQVKLGSLQWSSVLVGERQSHLSSMIVVVFHMTAHYSGSNSMLPIDVTSVLCIHLLSSLCILISKF